MESSKRRKISPETSQIPERAAGPSSKRKLPVGVPSPAPAQPAPVASDNDDLHDNEDKPVEVEEHVDADTDALPNNTTFRDLGVADSLCDACESLGYTKPTPIQRESIPISLQGRDVIGLAETGSGKTVAFALPILQSLLGKPQPFHSLVLAPTRELAVQISDAFGALGAQISLRTACLVGGLDMTPQSISLGKKPHVIIATPGRLLDHLERTKNFSLRNLKYLVLDEADRLLDMDFGDIIDKILKFIPRERRSLLFSATMSSKVESLQRASLRDPIRVETKTNKYQTVKSLVQSYLFVPHKYKSVYLIYLMNEFAGKSIIIFMRLVQDTQRLALMLRALGFPSVPLHGQLSQTARLGALNKFKLGTRNILVATDVAARGLDIPQVDLVINYDLPQDSKTYVHRVGRTARAGKAGQAITIATQYDTEVFQRIEKALGFELPEYKHEKEEVMVFRTRVEEAERESRQQMKQLMEQSGRRGSVLSGRHRGRGPRRADNMDAEEA